MRQRDQYRFSFGREQVAVPVRDVERAEASGWAWAAEVPRARLLEAGRCVYRVDDETGERRLVAVLSRSRDIEAAAEIARAFPATEERPAAYTDLAGIPELAARLGVSPAAVRKWRQRHLDFPAPLFRLSRQAVFDATAVAAWARLRRSSRAS